jgi:hypothetical protein
MVFEGIDAHGLSWWLNLQLNSENCSLSEAIAPVRESSPISFAARALLLRLTSPPALWCSCFTGREQICIQPLSPFWTGRLKYSRKGGNKRILLIIIVNYHTNGKYSLIIEPHCGSLGDLRPNNSFMLWRQDVPVSLCRLRKHKLAIGLTSDQSRRIVSSVRRPAKAWMASTGSKSKGAADNSSKSCSGVRISGALSTSLTLSIAAIGLLSTKRRFTQCSKSAWTTAR